MASAPDEFDYIVVGSGAGGGTVAAGLADLGHDVLLVEAGEWPEPDPWNYAVPAFYAMASEDESSWAYYVRHYADDARQKRDYRFVRDGGNGVLYPRAGTLGGCTAHYAMIMIAAHDSDWNGIAEAVGDTSSWSADAMRPYLDRVMARRSAPQDLLRNLLTQAGLPSRFVERIQGRVGGGLGAGNGWLQVGTPDLSLALGDPKVIDVIKAAFLECQAAGLGVGGVLGSVAARLGVGDLFRFWRSGLMNWKLDPNDRDGGVASGAEGLLIVPIATDGQRRQGTRERLRKIRDTSGRRLTVWTDALVTCVNLSADPPLRAQGVQVVKGAGRSYEGFRGHSAPRGGETFVARREVILAGGAFNSPQLLMLSGIGPGLRVDLPGVGRNLQDRYEVSVISEIEDDGFKLLKGMTFEAHDAGFQEWEQRRGVYTTNGGLIAFVKKSSAARARGADPDLFVFAVPSFFDGYYDGWSLESLLKPPLPRDSRYAHGKKYLSWVILKAHTSARGTVELASQNPVHRPRINFNSFEPGNTDCAAVVEAIEMVRGINRRLGWVEREVVPGPAMTTAADLGQFVMDNAWGHHASCTCPMGRDPARAVVDGKFRVHGVAGLRVVDASVFPKIPGFFVVLPTYMIAEKAVDVIHASSASPPQVGGS